MEKINLKDIPVKGLPLYEMQTLFQAKGAFTRPSKETIKRFENALKAARAKVTIRVEKGADSSAACGQLRATVIKEKQSCTE